MSFFLTPPAGRRPAGPWRRARLPFPALAAGLVLALGLSACGSSPGAGGGGGAGLGFGNGNGNGVASGTGSGTGTGGTTTTPKYDATVRRTTYGIPHIQAADFGSVGYGYGYAFAEDNLCLMMEDIITVRGERARYFGRNGAPYVLQATGVSAPNIDSDFFWRHVATDARLKAIHDRSSADGLRATVGFKDGFNRYMRELQAGQHPGRHQSCATAEWLKPLTEDDMYRRYYRLAVLASNSVFLPGIATAQPPVGGSSAASAAVAGKAAATSTATAAPLAGLSAPQRAELARHYPFGGELNIGSNMYAIGPDGTQDGQPIQFINPHFPWKGTERLYMAHLTVPGQADIMGVGLYGVPAILIGFNNHFAWSHTVSSAYRFTFYELTLAPGDPTSYVYAGTTTKMTPHPMTIDVKEDDGSLTKASRTLYDSRFGPMLTYNVSVNGTSTNIFPWSTSKAYTLRDANAENTRLVEQFLAWNKAQSLTEFKALHASVNGVPWVNTTATGPGETAYYGDLSVVPNVPDSLVTSCSTSAQAQALSQLAPGLPLLDGSMAACEWLTDADAAAPGVFGPKNQPKLERRDFVSNNNDSYWLTNPAAPLTGYARIFGLTGTARSLRTRHSLLKMQRRLAGTDGLATAPKWTPELLKTSVLNSYIYSAELARDAVVANLCSPSTGVTSSGATVDVTKACAALKAWDMTNNLDSKGGHIWREFWRKASTAQGFYTTAFSASDPVNTPRDVNTASPQVRQAFYDAVALFDGYGIAPDAAFGTISHATFDPTIPIFGSVGNLEGGFTIATGTLSKTGYDVTFGNSIVGVVTWDKATGRVVPDAFLTYSQSTDPANPHFSDFTKAYSKKQWQRLPFAADEVAAQQEGAALRLTE